LHAPLLTWKSLLCTLTECGTLVGCHRNARQPTGAFGSEQELALVEALAAKVQEATGDSVEVVFVDQGYTGEVAAAAAEKHGIRLEVVKLPAPSAALCCSHAGGSWNAALPGWRASDA
jgi:hypothetical protein